MLRTWFRDQNRSLPQLMLIQLRANLVIASMQGPCHHISIEDRSAKAWRLDQCCRSTLTSTVAAEFVPARVHAWAVAQLPAYVKFDESDPATRWWPAPEETWHVITHISHPDGEPTITYHDGTVFDFAILLRGIRSYQRKQYRQARKLAAQLWRYHLAQQTALQADQLSELVVGASGITHRQLTVPAVAEPMDCETSQPCRGLLPRLRRALVAKIHQVAVAAEAALMEGAQVA
jgi:hypothetical protein